MKILARAKCSHCGQYCEVVEDGDDRICRNCLSRILAFAMKNKAREPKSQEGVRQA